MTGSSETIRVVIPLTIRKRNGRPKVLPPDDVTLRDGRAQDVDRRRKSTPFGVQR